jgi:hypothetical protein
MNRWFYPPRLCDKLHSPFYALLFQPSLCYSPAALISDTYIFFFIPLYFYKALLKILFNFLIFSRRKLFLSIILEWPFYPFCTAIESLSSSCRFLRVIVLLI